MKHVGKSQRGGKRQPVHGPADSAPEGAFDVWLQRGLHQLFDGVAREPIPDELMRIIEEDRNKT